MKPSALVWYTPRQQHLLTNSLRQSLATHSLGSVRHFADITPSASHTLTWIGLVRLNRKQLCLTIQLSLTLLLLSSYVQGELLGSMIGIDKEEGEAMATQHKACH